MFGAYTIGFLSQQEIKNVVQLGIMSQLRGMDSTGVFTLRRKKNEKVHIQQRRTVGDATRFLYTPDTKQLLSQDHTFLISGHSRFATSGAVNERNAQPIHEGHIVAVHNGTITEFEPPNDEFETNTDSRVLVRKIANCGLARALDEAREGAWALSYFDMRGRTLHFTRNWRRSLFFMWNHSRTCFYWASERGMLDLLREREGHGSFLDPQAFIVDKLYTFKVPGVDYTIADAQRPRAEQFRPITPDNSIFRRAHEALEHVYPSQHKPPETKLLPKPREEDVKVTEFKYCLKCQKEQQYCVCLSPSLRQDYSVPLVRKSGPPWWSKNDKRAYRGWKRVINSVESVRDYLHDGCVMCSKPMYPEDDVNWISATQVVCHKCMKDKFVHMYLSCNAMFKGWLMQRGSEGNETRH